MGAVAEDILAYLAGSMTPDMRIKAGYNISEVVLQCAYNGVKCSTDKYDKKNYIVYILYTVNHAINMPCL